VARDMTAGSETRHILTFALPIMGGLVLQQLYNTVDSVVVGRVLGEAALSAVGTCAALTMLVVSFATGLCNGAGVLYAQLFGARRYDDLRRSLSTGLLLLGALSILISALAIALTGPLFRLLRVPEEVWGDALGYFRIYCLGLIFQFIYNVVSAALRSVGDSQATLWFLLVSSVLNILLDMLFVIALRWGVAGTAIATVLCQAVCAVISVVYMVKKYSFYRFGKGQFVYEGEKSRLILRLGVPTMIQMCIVSGGNVLIQSVVNSLGTAAIAANTAAGRIEGYLFVPAQGLNNGISTFAGQNLGAGKPERVRSGRRKARAVLVPVAIGIAILLFLFAGQLIALFGVEGEALTYGIQHLRFIAPFFVVFCLYMSNAGALTGTGDVKITSVITLSVLFVRVVLTYLFRFTFDLGFASLYIPNPIGWGLGMVLSFLRFRSGIWETKGVVRRLAPKEESEP